MLLDRERAAEILGGLDWFDIAEAQLALDAEDFWTDAWLVGALDRAKRSQIRAIVRSLRSEDGAPVFASVVSTDADGEEHRVYKAERLFDVDDYVATIDYHEQRARRHLDEAAGYRSRGLNRHGEQLRFRLREGAA